MTFPEPTLRHIARLTNDTGIIEHARGSNPRPELGACTDDAGRALAVAVRAPRLGGELGEAERIARVCVAFLARAHIGDGRFHLRSSIDGGWSEDPVSEDASGRAIFGLGVAAAAAPWPDVRDEAWALFHRAASFRSRWPRAMAHGAVGAVELLRAEPNDAQALDMAREAAAILPVGPSDAVSWPWPERRLGYANALLPEGLLAAGEATGDARLVETGLRLLRWLIEVESAGDRFSFTPVGGWAPGEPRPGFDQQPIEAGAIADAGGRAFAMTGDSAWRQAVDRAAAWFLGANDAGLPMWDAQTGGAFDGLGADAVNQNQGAESTIAMVTAFQQARASAEPTGRDGRGQLVAEASASSSSPSEISAAPTDRSAAP